MKKRFENPFLKIIVLAIAVIFALKYAGETILKSYIELGIGNCSKLPILCKAPEEEISITDISAVFLKGLVPYSLDEVEIKVPRNFTVVKEHMQKAYYKKQRKDSGDFFYLLYEKPDFFVNLFPRMKKAGVYDDYEFLARTMNAKTPDIEDLTDTFFVIMKSIFIPNLGDQQNAIMIKFRSKEKKGFINYNLSASGNYFDCNLFNNEGDFFKIYIVDKNATLDLNKLFAILSTVKKSS